jgi:hypothetical protein
MGVRQVVDLEVVEVQSGAAVACHEYSELMRTEYSLTNHRQRLASRSGF